MVKIIENQRKWWIFFGMAAALSIVFLDQSAISIALPPIQKDLNMGNVMLQWVINAYLLSIAALVIFGGKLGDIFGHKRIFLTGITIFVLSSISCAMAQSSFWIIFSRTIQGIGGAFMIPVTAVMIARAFSESERGKVMGLYIAVASVFLSLGPLLSGLLVHYLSWRWVFWINLPVSLISIFLTIVAVPASENRPESSKPLDWLGFISFSIFVISLVVALMEGVNLGWNSIVIISLFLAAGIFLIAFIYIESKAADPIVYLPLFKKKEFFAASMCMLLFTCAFSSIVFWAILLRNVMNYSSVIIGFFYLPVTLPVMFLAPLGGKLRDKYGARFPTVLGSVLVTLGAFWIAASVFKGSYSAMFPGFLLFGLGPSLIYGSVMATSISAVPLSQMGMASGISNGIRQLGRVLGVAIIGSVISNIQHYQLRNALPGLTHKLSTQQMTTLLSGSDAANNLLATFSPQDADYIQSMIKSSFTFAFSISMVATGGLLILTFLFAFLLPKTKPSPQPSPASGRGGQLF